MGRYHAILFDMDGTLLDTLTDMQDAVNHVLAAHGLPLRTLEEVRRFVGNGAGPLIHRALPEGYPQEQKVLAEYRAYYQAHNCIRTCPYPGIPELLEQLRQRGLKLAVVSNKPDETTRTLAARFFPANTSTGVIFSTARLLKYLAGKFTLMSVTALLPLRVTTAGVAETSILSTFFNILL